MSETGGGSPGPLHPGKRSKQPNRDIGKTLMQLPAVLESMSDGFVAVSRDWRYTYVNAAAAGLLRQPARKLVGAPVFEAFPEARGTAFEEGFRTALEQNVATTFEAHYPPLKAWFECRCHPGEDGISVFFTDVTQRKQAEEAMRRSERLAKSRLREIETIYNGAHVGLCAFDRKLRFIRINERLAEINGLPAAQHIGKTVREVLPGLADTTEELAERVFRTGEPVLDFEFSGITAARPGVMRHWVEHWLPLKTDSGKVAGINVVVNEVTEQKEAQNRLAYLASFPLRNPNPIMEVNLDGDPRYMNPAALRLFPDLGERGISHPWLADWAKVVAPFRQGQAETGVRDLTLGERTYQQAFYYSSQEGFVRIYGLDITERKKAEVALQEAHEELQTQTEELRLQTEELAAANEELQSQQEELQAQAQELRQAEQALRQLNEELEHRVAERTVDLSVANEAVRAERQRFNDVLETLPAYVVLLTPDYHVLFANRFFRERFGESHGKRCFEYLFNRTEPCEVCDTYTVLKTNKPHRWEWTGPDGHIYDIYDFPFTDTDGSPLIMEMGINITDLKRAEAELKNHQEHLEELVRQRTADLQEANERLQAQTEELQAQQEELQMQAEELTTANEELRENEQALRQSEARYRSLAENMPSVLMRYDRELRVVYLSPKAQEITGVPIGQFIGKTNRQVGMPHDLCSLWEDAIGEVFRTGRDGDLEFSFPSPEGPKAFYLKLAPEFGSDGAVTHVLGISTDITERKRAEQKLAEENSEIALANRVLQVFVEETGEDLFDKALQIVMEATESRHGVFGYIDENGDLVCPSMSKLLDECEVTNKCIRYPQGKWKGLWSRALQEKQTRYTNEAPIVPKGHVPIRNNLAAPILFHDRVIGLLNLANKETEYTDADRELIESIANRVAPVLYAWVQRELRETERKQAEETVRRRAEEIERILEVVPAAVWVAQDPECLTITGNRRANEFYEAESAENVSATTLPEVRRFFAPDGRELSADELPMQMAAAKNQDIHSVELHVQTPSGRRIAMLGSAVPLRNEHNEVRGCIGTFLDITERKRAEQVLQEANELLQAQSEELAATNEELQTANEELRVQEQALQESLHQTQRTAERLNLLSDTAASLLASEEPQIIVESLCQAVMKFLDCQVFFNFLVDEQVGRLRLNACAGIAKKERKKIEWLDFGTAVCGCVALGGQRIVAEYIPNSNDERTTLVKSYGIKAYACHPIIADAKVLGTVSFGTKTRETFRDDELTLMKAVTDMVALAVQRQQVRQALSESERRYRSLFEQMNEGFGLHEIVCDQNGQPCDYRFLDVNPAFEQLTGLKRENVVGRLISEVLPDNDSCWVEAFGRVALTGEPTHIEQYSTPLQRHYDVYAYRPAPRQFAVVFMEVTQRRQMEAEVRRLNEQLEEKVAERTEQLTRSIDRMQDEMTRRVLAEGKLRKHSRMLEGFFLHTITPLAFLDSRFNFIRVNEAYASVEKKDPKYFVGKNHFELYPHEENQAIFEQVVRTKQPYRAYARPFAYPDDPQRVTYWDWQLTPLLSEFGDVQFLVLNLADVTEQQQAFQELERRARQLQRLTLELSQAEDRERRRLAEILHDDLQQMLAAAKFHLGILSNRVKNDASAQEITGQVSQMLRDAIDQSRSLSHELSPMVLYEGDLGETFEWLAQQVHSKHGLLVHVEAHGRIESHSDAMRAFLFRTAQEMLFNAVKHAKANEARLRLRRVRGRIWMTISDQGRGFDPKALSRSAGYGLLSIRERVELLGGRMRIRSAPDRGSTFLIAVPDPQRTENREQKTEDRRRTTVDSLDSFPVVRLRILLVDDHEIVREGLAALLGEQDDMEIVGQAGNGREAVDLTNKLRPDVVIMDASMPVMAGDEATRQIKQLLPATRIIALSMFEEGQTAKRMRKAGAETYLLKTAPSEQLLAAIRGKRDISPERRGR